MKYLYLLQLALDCCYIYKVQLQIMYYAACPSYSKICLTVFIGDALLVKPIVDPGQTSTNVYFPGDDVCFMLISTHNVLETLKPVTDLFSPMSRISHIVLTSYLQAIWHQMGDVVQIMSICLYFPEHFRVPILDGVDLVQVSENKSPLLRGGKHRTFRSTGKHASYCAAFPSWKYNCENYSCLRFLLLFWKYNYENYSCLLYKNPRPPLLEI